MANCYAASKNPSPFDNAFNAVHFWEKTCCCWGNFDHLPWSSTSLPPCHYVLCGCRQSVGVWIQFFCVGRCFNSTNWNTWLPQIRHFTRRSTFLYASKILWDKIMFWRKHKTQNRVFFPLLMLELQTSSATEFEFQKPGYPWAISYFQPKSKGNCVRAEVEPKALDWETETLE